jgi:putative flippase GtrA
MALHLNRKKHAGSEGEEPPTMASLSDAQQANLTLPRVGRFMTVGMLGTVLDVGLFTVLHVLLGVPTLAANTTSYSAGIVNNFILHRRWTFAGRLRKEVGVQFAQFVAVSLAALVMNNLLVLLLEPQLSSLFPTPAYGDICAKVCATGVGMCWSLLVNNFWTFRAPTR